MIIELPHVIDSIRWKNEIIPISVDLSPAIYILSKVGISDVKIICSLKRDGSYNKKIYGYNDIKNRFLIDLKKIESINATNIILPFDTRLNTNIEISILTRFIYKLRTNKYLIEVRSNKFIIESCMSLYIPVNKSEEGKFIVVNGGYSDVNGIGDLFINNNFIPYNEMSEQFIRAVSMSCNKSKPTSITNNLLFYHIFIDDKVHETIVYNKVLNICSTNFTEKPTYNLFIPFYNDVISNNYIRFAKILNLI
ncbi:MAG: hypothetical protein KatS3mg002_1338 [Candidatus Woesearchaeota archaeon]|nr:MAG: hypothetical protein KatS3mg002_1338 [Candidatus Woesearchaeota archaeon]